MSADTTGAATAGAVPTRDESRFFMFDVFIREAGARRHALGRRSSARDQAQQRALARAIAADDAGALGAERQAKIIE